MNKLAKVKLINSYDENGLQDIRKDDFIMDENFRNDLIKEIIIAIKGTHQTYWKLYAMSNDILLKLYETLVPEEQRRISLKNILLKNLDS